MRNPRWGKPKPPKGYVDAYADFLMTARDFEEDNLPSPPEPEEPSNKEKKDETDGDKR